MFAPSARPKHTDEQLDLLNANADDVRERRLRETNVVIFGLPKAVGADPATRQKAVEQTVRTLVKDALKSNIVVGRIRRFAGPSRSYDGPILVSFDSVGSRNAILQAAK